jgi:uncharacterized protein YndB with AHSA1/START domain
MEEKLLFRLEEFIDAPIDVVFDYLDDDDKIRRWNDFFVENIYENGKQESIPGTKFTSVQRIEKKTIRTEIVLTEYDPPNKIIMEGYSKEGKAFTRYFLYKEYDGTRVVMESSIIPSNLYYRIITKLFGGLGKFLYKEQVQQLKDDLEMRDFD